MKSSMIQSYALAHADPSELLYAVAEAYTNMHSRMESMEQSLKEVKNFGIQSSPNGANPASPRPKAKKISLKSDMITPPGAELAPMKGEHDHCDLTIEPKPTEKAQKSVATQSTCERANESAGARGNCAQRIRDAIAKRPS